MKNKSLFICVSLAISMLFCACQPELTAEMVIQKSLEEAHGGKALWETPKVLIYEKTTTFYTSDGKVESIKKQTFHNTLKPTFTSKVKWMEEDVEKRIVFDGKETFVFTDGYQVTDDSIVEAAHKEIMGAQYVLWQPYKLLTDEATIVSEGIVRLEDKTDAYSIKVTYPNSDTIWWYYFDIHTFLLKENLIQHSETTYSQIVNLKQEENTGLRLHQDRKSFKVDVGKDEKYLRATYHYNILELK
ncbi:hypothetical protein [uncultured Kordia sp.]|uniref:hypothetical protein n=1 Tax=uncultured Kordia sp. TaxID=507699 RepID=UPI00260C459C|nr:hypothetical protein [uncultured Kordia sp.]